jgi:hypothetical protein
VLSVALPSYADRYRSVKQARRLLDVFGGELRHGWVEVDQPVAMDGVLLRIGGRPLHVGLMLDGTRFLHVDRGIETCVQEIDGIEWRDRVLGYYRLASRPQALMAS